jgi:hypothetical protein
MKVKVVKREERERRIRPVVTKKLLLDEKSRLVRRVKQINEQLRTVEA